MIYYYATIRFIRQTSTLERWRASNGLLAWRRPSCLAPTFLPAPRWSSSVRLSWSIKFASLRNNFIALYLIETNRVNGLTNFKLSLDATLAPFTVVRLRPVVLGHDFDKLARQRRVLSLAYPQIRRWFVRLLFVFDVLLDHCPINRKPITTSSTVAQKKKRSNQWRKSHLWAWTGLCWPSSWSRPSNLPALVSPLQQIKFSTIWIQIDYYYFVNILSSVCGADKMAECFFLTSSTLVWILSIFSRISLTWFNIY